MLGSAKMASGQPLPELLKSRTFAGNWARSTISNFTRLAWSACVLVHRSAIGLRAASIHTVTGAVSSYGLEVGAGVAVISTVCGVPATIWVTTTGGTVTWTGAPVTWTWTVWMMVCGV